MRRGDGLAVVEGRCDEFHGREGRAGWAGCSVVSGCQEACMVGGRICSTECVRAG